MKEIQSANYEKLTRQYLSGRIPFRIWFFSSALGAMTIIVNNLIQHEAFLQGFFSTLFMNLVFTIPLFLVQAHFMGKALLRNSKNVSKVLVAILVIGWAVTVATIAYGLSSIYDGSLNLGAMLMIINFGCCMIWWVAIFYFTTLRKLQKS